MTITEFNSIVNRTISLVEELIFVRFDNQQMETVQKNLLEITENGFRLLKEPVQLKTCYNLRHLKVESFRLSIIEQMFFGDGRGTRGKVTNRNSEEQIKKRYLLNIDQVLPILIIKMPVANR